MLCWSASAFNQQMADGEHCDCEHASFRNSLVEMQNLVLIYSMASLLNQGKRVGLEMTCRLTRCNWIPFIIALFEIQFVRPMNAFLSVPDIDGCPWSHIFERNLKIRMYVCPDNRCRKLKLENKLFFFKLFFSPFSGSNLTHNALKRFCTHLVRMMCVVFSLLCPQHKDP